MTKEEVINLARSAGLEILDFGQEQEVGCGDGYHIQTDLIERFAALVAEQERQRICNMLLDMHAKEERHNYYLFISNIIKESK